MSYCRATALVGGLVAFGVACKRPAVQPPRDAGAHVATTTTPALAHDDAGVVTARDALDGAALPEYGPPNPWGDGAIPVSTATGPEADATRGRLAALRASIGFWRVERNARQSCPTLEDLARAPAAAFDPATMERDAWGTRFVIDCQGARVRLRSLGPDRVADTPDDIVAP